MGGFGIDSAGAGLGEVVLMRGEFMVLDRGQVQGLLSDFDLRIGYKLKRIAKTRCTTAGSGPAQRSALDRRRLPL